MARNDEEVQRYIEDQHILIDLLREELAESKAREKALTAQVQALMKGQRVNYEVG